MAPTAHLSSTYSWRRTPKSGLFANPHRSFQPCSFLSVLLLTVNFKIPKSVPVPRHHQQQQHLLSRRSSAF